MTVYDLNADQLLELKWAYYSELIESGETEVMGDLYVWEIPDDIIFNHYAGVNFVPEDFSSSLDEDDGSEED